MLAKLDALESELARLLSALRTSGERLAEGLAELQQEAAAGLTADESGAGRAQHEELRTRRPANAPAADAASRPADAPERRRAAHATAARRRRPRRPP